MKIGLNTHRYQRLYWVRRLCGKVCSRQIRYSIALLHFSSVMYLFQYKRMDKSEI